MALGGGEVEVSRCESACPQPSIVHVCRRCCVPPPTGPAACAPPAPMRPAPVVRVCALYKLFRRLAISNAARLRFQHDDIRFSDSHAHAVAARQLIFTI